MVDFIEASPLRYALTVKPTVYVSHIRQFWSTARIETTEEGTQILATVDGIYRTVTESSLRRNIKLKDEEGISSLHDTKLFENLTLIGYNISLNQKFTFQKGQFSHQWKYLIHTIMQCLSPKSTRFNEFSSNIATALVCLATNRTYNFSKMIFDGLVKNVNNKGEGSGTPTEPHHTPSPEAQSGIQWRTRIAQSSAPPIVADEHVSPLRDVSQGEACPTDSGFIADQDRVTIDKSSTLPHDLAPRLKERVKLLEDRERVAVTRTGDDAPIKGRSMDEGEAATKRISDDSEEMATVMTSMDASIVLASGVVDVPTGNVSIPTASTPAEEQVPTGSEVVPTASPVFATATVVTPYRRRKGKEVMVEFKTPKKQKVQEQIDAQVTRELEEQLERGSEKESAKKQKTSEEVPEEVKHPEEVPEEKVKEMMQLVPIKEVYVEALQVKHPIINWKETLSNRPPTSNKEMELWVELNRLYEPDDEDQLWTHTQKLMHAPVDWRLYDTFGVHHVTAKDKDILMLVEKDYPFRKALALVMISYKLQVENYSQMANDLVLKIYKLANSLRQQGD
nr:synaptobrevin, longin-like domain protein [Tanacetum cinerariifolium]